jgi:CheY-like chemotaxis protein
MIQLPTKHRVLVVDDEPDIYSIIKLSLRGLAYNNHQVEFAACSSGEAAIEDLKAHPETSVVLMDVVMESESAGLDTCRAIRDQLGNQLVRLLLITDHPGTAPEKQVVDECEVDGYLLKTELTTTRLYTAVRTALKAYEELVQLQRHCELLSFVNETAASLHAFDDLEVALQKILATTAALTNAEFSMMSLETFDGQGDPNSVALHLSSDEDSEEKARQIASEVQINSTTGAGLSDFAAGIILPIQLYREMGAGWIYFEGDPLDAALEQVLPMLGAHVCNSLYAIVAQRILDEREGPFYDSLGI